MQSFNEFLTERLRQDPDLKTKKSTPAKNYKGLGKGTKEARERHWEKNRDKADNDSSAYEPAPGDKDAKTKPSKYTKAFEKRFGSTNEDIATNVVIDLSSGKKEKPGASKDSSEKDTEEENNQTAGEVSEDVMDLEEGLLEEDSSIDTALKNKAEKSGIPLGILRQVFNRGKAAWKGSHKPGTNPDQWGLARCNSFITGGKTRFTADKDLWEKASAAKKKKKGKNSK
jgi:hypothetical protein